VLRGGLTSKHVDVPELLRVLDFTPRTPPVLRGAPEGGWVRYDTDAAEFLLRRFEGPAGTDVAVPDGGPRILLCTAGSALVRAAGAQQVLGRGRALWLPFDDRDVTLVAQEPGTQLFLAGDGLDI
jgi:mannose-6-phosphate isomerase